MRNFAAVFVLLLVVGFASADEYVTATPIGVQDNPYDLQELLSGAVSGEQDNPYDNQPVAGVAGVDEHDDPYDRQPVTGAAEVGAQDTVYDQQTVLEVVEIFEQTAKIPIVNYSATYVPENNKTVVEVNVVSDPVAMYHVFIYDLNWNLLEAYSSESPTSTAEIDGEHYNLYVVVITNSIGISGMDFGIYPASVVGTNIIPVLVRAVDKYDVVVYGGYAISPVFVADTSKPVYVIATSKIVHVQVSPVR